MSLLLQAVSRVSSKQLKFRSAKYNLYVISSFSHFSTSDSKDNKKDTPAAAKGGFLDSLYGKESNYAPASFKNRWLMVVPAFMTHICIGSPYAWSLLADATTRELGVVASAADDWGLLQTALPLSLVFAMQGVAAASLGYVCGRKE